MTVIIQQNQKKIEELEEQNEILEQNLSKHQSQLQGIEMENQKLNQLIKEY